MTDRLESESVAFQGEPGAFSDGVAKKLRPRATTRGYGTFDEVAAAVDGGEAGSGVLPVENSIVGAIPRVYDLLWIHERLTIVDEHVERIVQSLIGTQDAQLGGVHEVRSHPVALEQCRAFLSVHARWRSVIVADTAGAVAAIVAGGDPSVAAIASSEAARHYGAKILCESIQDVADNFTRFFLVRRRDANGTETTMRTEKVRACVALALENRPGSLRDALAAFADREINLRSLVSRPSLSGPFAYRFYCEIEDAGRAVLSDALAHIAGTTRVLGAY